MEKFIEKILTGFKQWILSNLGFVISRHINELYDLVVYNEGKNITIDEDRTVSAIGYVYNKSNNSITDGEYTVTRNNAEHASGKYNKSHKFYQFEKIKFVDLGLPSGTLWASCNLGATNVYDSGNFYAWGEVEADETRSYIWDNYLYARIDGQQVKLTKYCNNPSYGLNGYVDNLTQLQLEDDAVYNNEETYEQLWRIPTTEQFKELLLNTNKKLVRIKDNNPEVWAIEFKNKNKDLSIETLYIPIYGAKMNKNPYPNNITTQLWTSDINEANPLEAKCLKITKKENQFSITDFNNSTDVAASCLQRFGGTFIRPVSDRIQSDGTLFSVGIGMEGERKNAIEIINNGDIYVYGVGNYDGTKTSVQDPSIKSLQDILKNSSIPDIDSIISNINSSITNINSSISNISINALNDSLIVNNSSISFSSDTNYIYLSASNNNLAVNSSIITLTDASNGLTGLAIAQDIYKELVVAEDVIASAQIQMANNVGLDTSFNLVWSEESGLTEENIKEAIENILSQISMLDDHMGTGSEYSSLNASLQNKVDKSNVSNIIYGTNSLGAQTVYTLGTGLDISNNQIVNTSDINIPEVDISNGVSSMILSPNTLYKCETRTADLSLGLRAATQGIVNEYHIIIPIGNVGSAVPNITWPDDISWYGGSRPSLAANKTYEVSILNNIAISINV